LPAHFVLQDVVLLLLLLMVVVGGVTGVLLLHMHQALLAAAVPAAALLAGYVQLCTYGPRLQASLFNPPQVASCHNGYVQPPQVFLSELKQSLPS
jgi:hypothetical protein